MTSYRGSSALVTGASAGLGAEFARQLAADVSALVLVARRRERLEELRDELLEKHTGLLVKVVVADLSAPAAVDDIVDEIEAAGIHIDVLINNAGLGDIGTFHTSNAAKLERMLLVNINALTLLAHRLLPGMVERGEGIVVNVGSTAGFAPLPTFAVYAATKAYVNSLSEALAVELRGTGVKVCVMCPGPIETEFGQVAGRPDGERKFAPPKILTERADRAVAETLRAALRGRSRVVPGGVLIKAGGLLMDFAPTPLQRVLLKGGSSPIIKRETPAGS